MPRPLSWLPRLHEISRGVANSVRSHYDRHDIEAYSSFSRKRHKMLPSVQVGTSRLLDREVLCVFLERVQQADNLLKDAASGRKPRSLVRRDLDPVNLASLPDSITLVPGRVQVDFRSVEQLAESLLMLARVLESEGEQFAVVSEVRDETATTGEAWDERNQQLNDRKGKQ